MTHARLISDNESAACGATTGAASLDWREVNCKGHCWWHVENPDREYPCETCSPEAQANGAKWAVRVRDVLPAGPGNEKL